MKRKTKRGQNLEDSLAEGIAAVMAASESAGEEPPPEVSDMADLFLDELNRLWAEPLPDEAAA
jgi:hypothetical protein